VQAASIAFPTFEAPAWALRVFVFVAMLGFPIALVIAWAFEFTPEGLRIDPAQTGNKRMVTIVAALAALAVTWYFVGAPAVRDAGAAERSIAVLPFVNMSGDSENEYFSDGISEEILNVLAQTPGLKVAARTSSFSYKGKTKEVPDIARELEVRMVLEGSVRKQGEKVRITAQLIDAAKGFHLWSKTYDRDLKDIFAIQDEIAREIGKQLQVELGGARGADGVAGTTNLEAHDLYLQGLSLFQQRGKENMHAADERFRAALARDPKFAKAWGALALVHSAMPNWDPATDRIAGDRIRYDAAERELALDPTLPEGWLVLAIKAYDEARYDTGNTLFERTLGLAPSYAQAYQWYGEALAAAGDIDGGLAQVRKGLALDPKAPINKQAVGNLLVFLGRFDEAAPYYEALMAEMPDQPRGYGALANAYIQKGEPEKARPLIRRVQELRGRNAASTAAADRVIDGLAGKLSKGELQALAVKLAAMPEPGTGSPDDPWIGTQIRLKLFSLAGREDLAAPELVRYAKILPDVAATLYNAPMFDSFRCRADWQALEQPLNVPDRRPRDGLRGQGLMSLIEELKRRKVFKVGAAYLVVAWLVVQAASIGFPAFDAPTWALRSFILVAFLGFPVALVMAWVFDATPEGVKLDPASTGTVRVFAVATLLAVLALFWYYRGQPSYRAGDVPAVSDAPSVAVLPFANLSGKADEDYFSDGMTEELLNVLAKVPKLKVAARTSVFAFKGKGGDVKAIGRELGVNHIVEGSIRREGDHVRVTAQLVRVLDGFHVWSENYDREVKSVIALQDEIAKRIGDQLTASLGVTAPAAARAQVDPVAYDEYLKGRTLLRSRKDLPGAIAHFQSAVAKAPDFAAAWSSLSLAQEVTFWYLKVPDVSGAARAAGQRGRVGQAGRGARTQQRHDRARARQHGPRRVPLRRGRAPLPARDGARPELPGRARGLRRAADRRRPRRGIGARRAAARDARSVFRRGLDPGLQRRGRARPARGGRRVGGAAEQDPGRRQDRFRGLHRHVLDGGVRAHVSPARPDARHARGYGAARP
jgi:TolB-like protein/Tfp pilus assembly protein PilF